MRVKCPQCGQVVTAPDDAKDAQGRCPHCDATFGLAAAERVGLSAGDRLGDFRIDGLIGRGGMATVYRATQLSLDRPVAIKVLAPRLARRKQFVERFQREAQVLGQLSHPHIVRVLSVGAEGDTYYLVMEYADGESLRARLSREGALPFDEAARLIGQVAAGLEYAHSQGVLHRDIKPGNILIMADGTPKIADFGIAGLVGGDTAKQHLTMAGAQLGSAHYVAPEQMKDASRVDHRADIYALGVLLYKVLTAELPVGQFKPASSLVPGVPPSVDRVIATALAPSPDERYDTAAAFRAALQSAAAAGPPPKIRVHKRRAQRAPRSSSSSVAAFGAAVLMLAAVVCSVAYLATRQTRRAVLPQPLVTPPVVPHTPIKPRTRAPAVATPTPPEPKHRPRPEPTPRPRPKPEPSPRPPPQPPAPTPKPRPKPPQPPPAPLPEGPTPEPFSLVVTARIDGISDLVITPGAIHWEHKKWHRPGTPEGHRTAKYPTVLNGKLWFPEWVGNRSDRVSSRRLPKSFAGFTCDVTRISGRGSVKLVEATDRRLAIRFSDTKPGADDYQVRIFIAPTAPTARKR